MTTQRFPWAQLMRLGIHDLKFTPTEFWRSTLRELGSAAGPHVPPASLSELRQNLNTMMEQYPDAHT
jgi:uncharacterized phage protein (TIGR02216 family)